jgi:hypothetical protein
MCQGLFSLYTRVSGMTIRPLSVVRTRFEIFVSARCDILSPRSYVSCKRDECR